MKIDTAMIKHLASLSALELNEEEIDEMKKDFERILKFVDQIESCEVSNQYKEDRLVNLSELREDKLKVGLTQEEVLLNAPKKKGGCFVVPQVVE
jgi:aspartyl-tRNA(Asn)/glutamyl-tRNA(Gln) amidotransferase subunit C